MFKVLKIDGPNILTDKGGIMLKGFCYADGGKTQPVSDDDWRRMRAAFIAIPDLTAQLRGWIAIFERDGAHASPLVKTAVKETEALLAKLEGR